MIAEDHVGDFRRVTLTCDGVVVSVLPQLGGKIETLRLASSKRNVLLAPPERRLRPARYGAPFEEYDTSGFDECFPTVSACPSPDDPEVNWPDHGELWSAAWACEPEEDSLVMETQGKALPYVFRRRISIKGQTLRLDYEVVSESDRAARMLWAAHMLLAASPGSRIHLPKEVESLFVNWSAGNRLGRFGDRCSWPQTKEAREGDSRANETSTHRLDILPEAAAQIADKLFTDQLREGRCAFHDRASDESLTFRFDTNRTPYIGLWICAGGWPTSPDRIKHYTVALEPSSGRPDSLMEAAQRNECLTLEARGDTRWWLEIELRAGEPEI